MELELLDSIIPSQTTVQHPPVQRHTHQILTRPNSLLVPEKEPIKFQINLVGAPSEVEQLIEHIKDVASQFLYHWKTFPLSKFKKVARTSRQTLNCQLISFRFTSTNFKCLDYIVNNFGDRPSECIKCRNKSQAKSYQFEGFVYYATF